MPSVHNRPGAVGPPLSFGHSCIRQEDGAACSRPPQCVGSDFCALCAFCGQLRSGRLVAAATAATSRTGRQRGDNRAAQRGVFPFSATPRGAPRNHREQFLNNLFKNCRREDGNRGGVNRRRDRCDTLLRSLVSMRSSTESVPRVCTLRASCGQCFGIAQASGLPRPIQSSFPSRRPISVSSAGDGIHRSSGGGLVPS